MTRDAEVLAMLTDHERASSIPGYEAMWATVREAVADEHIAVMELAKWQGLFDIFLLACVKVVQELLEERLEELLGGEPSGSTIQ